MRESPYRGYPPSLWKPSPPNPRTAQPRYESLRVQASGEEALGRASPCSPAGPLSPRRCGKYPDGMASILPPETLAEIRGDLRRQLSRLERSMAVTEEAVRPVELDQQAVGRLSRMDSLQSQHLSRNLQERERVRYTALQRALQRMEKGTYRVCTECGDPIEPGRLMVMPEGEHCPACAGG